MPLRKPVTPSPLSAAARKVNGMTTIDATMFAMIVASSWMPKTRHQEPRTSFAERLIDFTMPCFSSISAGEASEKRIISHSATMPRAEAAQDGECDAAVVRARGGHEDAGQRADGDDRDGDEQQQEDQAEQLAAAGGGRRARPRRWSPTCRAPRGW